MPIAARITDMHTCPQLTGSVPHLGGPILPSGARSVLIGSLPAARLGDGCQCIGAADSIITGSANVNIEGVPAARVGDATAHGGIIIQGCATVNIGG